ncbi:MAG: hypothetical protein PHC60_05555, partial [Heliobacteriaceae bacterium]|nr:hypothetical protein [Heliobacteriaceae bacterium]MDD4587829.1 hypothetical protein [Heliobacteriaceae bacterium]
AALVVDWLRQMLSEDPQTAPVYLNRIVAAWDRGEDRICRGAPHIIVAHTPESSLPVRITWR